MATVQQLLGVANDATRVGTDAFQKSSPGSIYNVPTKNATLGAGIVQAPQPTGPNVALTITGGWLRDSSTGLSITTVDTTGYTIFNAPDHVVAYSSGSSTSAKYLNTETGDLLIPLA